jgi:hypothetical protein
VSGSLLTLVVLYLALVACVGVLAAAGVPCVTAVRAGVVLAEVVLVVQLLVDTVTLLRGHRPAETATHLGYAAVSVILFPILAIRGLRDPARSDHLVTAVTAVVAVVVSVRMHATWASS